MTTCYALKRILLMAIIVSWSVAMVPALRAAPFRIVVLGDSILWGQGLLPADKIHSRVARQLQDCLGYDPIDITHVAHSGAIIGARDNTVQAPLPGEIPTSYPTVLQQCDSLSGSTESQLLIILDGGINDIGGMRVLHPFVPISGLLNEADLSFRQDMGLLLTRTSEKFPNATIVVTGYYQIISHETPLPAMAGLLTGAGAIILGVWAPVPGSTIGEGVQAIVTLQVRDTVASKCLQFATEANQKLRTAVNQANDANRSAGRSGRIVFADPGFQSSNAMLASQPWLYALNPDLSPQDDPTVAALRAEQCTQVGSPPAPPKFGCDRASMYHPNRSGAQAYADAIFAAYLNPDGLAWVAFNESCPTCGDGTPGNPFGSLTGGRNGVPNEGTILIRSGSSAETITINKSCRLQACAGPVTIGR